ncbi:MAG: HNH endonuclease [Armatimonadetes bacterium]|nr:HNH endonuclease [Armatimonadota bacterium]
MSATVCQLCERPVPETTNHHLVPKAVGRRRGTKLSLLPQCDLCRMCHKQLHALFTNKELATGLADVVALRAHPDVRKYLDFIVKHPGAKTFKAKKRAR